MSNVFPAKLASVLALAAMLSGPAWAQETARTEPGSGAAHDCKDVTIDYDGAPGLTREERIARMDEALTRSLNRYENCDEPESTDTSANPSGGGGGGAAAQGEAGEGESGAGQAGTGDVGEPESDGGVASQATSDIGGDEGDADETGGGLPGATVTESRPSGGMAGDEPEEPPVRSAGRVLPNGKLPEDIPSADNDSVLEAQIRQAAIDETDPELKKRLWNEYRRYKGLPQVE